MSVEFIANYSPLRKQEGLINRIVKACCKFPRPFEYIRKEDKLEIYRCYCCGKEVRLKPIEKKK